MIHLPLDIRLMMSARRALLASLLALSLLGTGCGSARMLEKAAPMFVPPLPNRPRLQFLASFVGGKDIEEESQFQEFLTGRKEQQGALSKPYSAVMLDDGIAVADAGAGELFVFDFKDRVFRTLRGNSGGGRAKKPINLSADKEGNLYVTDVGRNQVLSYAKDETYLRAYGKEGDMKPGGVAVHGNEVYVCDLAHHQIVVFDRRRGTLLRRLGSPGKEPGQLYFPTNIATGPNGDLYISETGNFRFQQMRPDGTSVRVVGAIGKTPGSFSRPKGIAVSPEGLVYIADAAFENVQIFDTKGELMVFFGGASNHPGGLSLPAGVSISTRGMKRFQEIADPRLQLEYLVVVVSQYGSRLVSVFGFGNWTGPEVDLPAPDSEEAAATESSAATEASAVP